MQHQYWVTKKCVLQRLGGKEDECVVASDAELDAKLELFKSVADGCVQLQRAIDLYQERICALAQEENALGRYMKEAGRTERNGSAGGLLCTAGKALTYMGHQRLTLRSPLVRLHHEVDTFRGRAVSDCRATIVEMEKTRTEYRAALSWMKAVSTQLDPDTGHGLDKFRKAQAQVRVSKLRFDRLMLACLQKVDLLAAARCNMFSHALVLYELAASTFSLKAGQTLAAAAASLSAQQPLELAEPAGPGAPPDPDQSTFFHADYSDAPPPRRPTDADADTDAEPEGSAPLIDSLAEPEPAADADPSLLDLNWQASSDLLGDLLPSHLLQSEQFRERSDCDAAADVQPPEGPRPASPAPRGSAAVSWLSLFADLDPLANSSGSV